ncbi:PH domain-containing protein [Enterococcus innesii]|uniref:PH domain-containing protein n=1 Tax=Enterococcus innesii TaxID=2839759 RepID=UPI003B5C926C
MDIKYTGLKTAADMADFCQEQGYSVGTIKKWITRHFKLIEEQLNDDEYVMFCFVGLHNFVSTTKHDNNYAYALTNKRLILAQQKVIGNNVQSIVLDNLNNVSKNAGMMYGTLTINTLGASVVVGVDKGAADNINDELNKIIYDLKNTANTSIVLNNSSAVTPVDEIRKYKELLDDGIISQEEFDKKKTELLF